MDGKEPTSKKITRTGTFTGAWNEICQFCGKPQTVHMQTFELPNEILFSRAPCEPEVNLLKRQVRVRNRVIKSIVFGAYVLLPLAILLIHEIQLVARIAFWLAILKLVWETIKIWGRPEKWFPAYGKRKEAEREKERRKAHFVYHCERNPEGFERLRNENFQAGR